MPLPVGDGFEGTAWEGEVAVPKVESLRVFTNMGESCTAKYVVRVSVFGRGASRESTRSQGMLTFFCSLSDRC